jgi:hypothetical protein
MHKVAIRELHRTHDYAIRDQVFFTLVQNKEQIMRFSKISLAALAAATLVSAPVVAQAKSTAKQAVAKVERKAAARKSESKMGGSILLAILALAAVVGGIVIATGSDDNTPTSP